MKKQIQYKWIPSENPKKIDYILKCSAIAINAINQILVKSSDFENDIANRKTTF